MSASASEQVKSHCDVDDPFLIKRSLEFDRAKRLDKFEVKKGEELSRNNTLQHAGVKADNSGLCSDSTSDRSALQMPTNGLMPEPEPQPLTIRKSKSTQEIRRSVAPKSSSPNLGVDTIFTRPSLPTLQSFPGPGSNSSCHDIKSMKSLPPVPSDEPPMPQRPPPGPPTMGLSTPTRGLLTPPITPVPMPPKSALEKFSQRQEQAGSLTLRERRLPPTPVTLNSKYASTPQQLIIEPGFCTCNDTVGDHQGGHVPVQVGGLPLTPVSSIERISKARASLEQYSPSTPSPLKKCHSLGQLDPEHAVKGDSKVSTPSRMSSGRYNMLMRKATSKKAAGQLKNSQEESPSGSSFTTKRPDILNKNKPAKNLKETIRTPHRMEDSGADMPDLKKKPAVTNLKERIKTPHRMEESEDMPDLKKKPAVKNLKEVVKTPHSVEGSEGNMPSLQKKRSTKSFKGLFMIPHRVEESEMKNLKELIKTPHRMENSEGDMRDLASSMNEPQRLFPSQKQSLAPMVNNNEASCALPSKVSASSPGPSSSGKPDVPTPGRATTEMPTSKASSSYQKGSSLRSSVPASPGQDATSPKVGNGSASSPSIPSKTTGLAGSKAAYQGHPAGLAQKWDGVTKKPPTHARLLHFTNGWTIKAAEIASEGSERLLRLTILSSPEQSSAFKMSETSSSSSSSTVRPKSSSSSLVVHMEDMTIESGADGLPIRRRPLGFLAPGDIISFPKDEPCEFDYTWKGRSIYASLKFWRGVMANEKPIVPNPWDASAPKVPLPTTHAEGTVYWDPGSEKAPAPGFTLRNDNPTFSAIESHGRIMLAHAKRDYIKKINANEEPAEFEDGAWIVKMWLIGHDRAFSELIDPESKHDLLEKYLPIYDEDDELWYEPCDDYFPTIHREDEWWCRRTDCPGCNHRVDVPDNTEQTVWECYAPVLNFFEEVNSARPEGQIPIIPNLEGKDEEIESVTESKYSTDSHVHPAYRYDGMERCISLWDKYQPSASSFAIDGYKSTHGASSSVPDRATRMKIFADEVDGESSKQLVQVKAFGKGRASAD